MKVYCRCGKPISVAAAHRGKRIKCKHCGRELRVNMAAQLHPRLGAVLTIASLAYAAVICLLALVLWRRGDVWWTGTVLLFIGRWIFLLPLAVLLPCALAFRRTLAIPLVFGALMCIGPLMGFRAGWRRMLPHPDGQHLRVLTYNVDGGDQVLPLFRGLLEETHPDFVALQECGTNMADALRALPGWFHHQERQLCILSRYALLDSTVMDRSLFEAIHASASSLGGSADVVRYRVKLPAGIVDITNLHLETPRKGLEGLGERTFNAQRLRDNTELRFVEAQRARAFVDSAPAPSIVVGDFNTPVESRIFQEIWGGYTDAFSRAGFGFGMTRNNGWIKVRIDHVLAGPGWRADHVLIGPDLGSDHLPLIVDLTLVPPK